AFVRSCGEDPGRDQGRICRTRLTPFCPCPGQIGRYFRSGPASPATIPPEFEHVQKLRARTGSVLLKTFDTERIGVTFPPPAPARPARPRLRALGRASGYRPGHGSVSDPARVRVRPAWPGRVAARRLVGMSALLERLLPLWTQPVDARDDPEAAFGQVYAD